jgi:hypothetical protein
MMPRSLVPAIPHGRLSLTALLVATILITGCEYVFSDVATRIRYRLQTALTELRHSPRDELTIALRPDHWPDACPRGGGYRLVISPYRGGKQVPVGDIMIRCTDGHPYYTGLGSETLYVAQDLTVDKRRDEDLRITLRKTAAGVEITQLE